ncbi:GDYXXLXY domain-containing protein [Castellaniella ginsengisoli]|uniref:GDYXXLXY domain-containing protein n=1 Tax=Castellaniella ginsengisoli TaxID=546114 RepID=A0AB39CK82_9BURK
MHAADSVPGRAFETTGWRLPLSRAAVLLAVVLAAAALVFWVASQWGRLGPDARLWLVRGALAGSALAAAVQAWRGRRGAAPAAGLSALCTGALLALVGQIYQTGADAWPLFLLWAALTLPWVALLRSVSLWLLCAALLNVALGLYLWAGVPVWRGPDEPWALLGPAVLNAGLLVLAERAGDWLEDPWRLARRSAAAALLGALWSASWQAWLQTASRMSADGSVLWLTALSVGVLAMLYWVYVRRRRDLAVGALTLLTGLGLLWQWTWPRVDDDWAMLGVILLLLGLGLAALRHLSGIWRAVRPGPGEAGADLAGIPETHAAAPAPQSAAHRDPWFLTFLRAGILGFIVLLLVIWVVFVGGIQEAEGAMLLGAVLLLPGLWLARGPRGALRSQLGEVLACVGLVLAGGGFLFLQTSAEGPLPSLAAILVLGAVIFRASALPVLRLATALVVLAVVLWLTWPAAAGSRGLFDPLEPGDWPPGLMLRLWWCQAGAVLAWVLSLRAGRRAVWRPLAWALLLCTPPLAWLATAFGAGAAWALPPADRLAGLACALLPGLILGAWLAARRALPARGCWLAAGVLCLASLGWLEAPGLSVALTWILLGRLAGHRPLQCLGAAAVLAGLYVFYLDPLVPLAHKAAGLGLAALWLAAVAGLAAWPDRRIALRPPARLAAWPRPLGMLAAGALALGAAQLQIHQYRSILAEGRPIVLQLAPVDPRSLMQGDYMALDYAVRRPVSGWLAGHPAVREQLAAAGRGWLVLRPDAQGVWQLAEVTAVPPDAAAGQAAGRTALAFHWRSGEADWGARSWFFPEGEGERYAQARYGVLRVAADGTALLESLLDEHRTPL